MSKNTQATVKVRSRGETRLCQVQVFGQIQETYDDELQQVLWIICSEDWYGQNQFKEPYCVLLDKDWYRGTVV